MKKDKGTKIEIENTAQKAYFFLFASHLIFKDETYL